MQVQQDHRTASRPTVHYTELRSKLSVLTLCFGIVFGASEVKAAHFDIDLKAKSMPDLIATSVLVGRIHPDNFPDIIRHNAGYFSSYPNTFACLHKLSSMLRSASLSNQQENVRNRAIETWGGAVPPEVYEGMPGGGDPRAVAAVQFAELANAIPSILQGDDSAYRNSSFYQSTVLGWHYLAEISGYLAILEGQTTGDPLEDMFNRYMEQVVRATLNQMAVATYKDTYQSALLIANAAC